MDDLNAKIVFLQEEIRKCKNMSSAASSLSGALSRIAGKLNSCSESISTGGLTIDGFGADVYAFGGYKQYVTTDITPTINDINSLCSTLNTAIINYDKDLTDCINERNRLKRLEEKEEKAKPIPLSKLLKE
jgi:hypothetical protein